MPDAPIDQDTALGIARLIGLDLPEPCLPGVIEGLEALRSHLRTLEAPEP